MKMHLHFFYLAFSESTRACARGLTAKYCGAIKLNARAREDTLTSRVLDTSFGLKGNRQIDFFYSHLWRYFSYNIFQLSQKSRGICIYAHKISTSATCPCTYISHINLSCCLVVGNKIKIICCIL